MVPANLPTHALWYVYLFLLTPPPYNDYPEHVTKAHYHFGLLLYCLESYK